MCFSPTFWFSANTRFGSLQKMNGQGEMMTGTELAVAGTTGVGMKSLDLVKIAPGAPWMTRIEEHPSWETLSQLRITMRVGVPLSRFRVRDVLTLKVGQVFESGSPETEDVPLMAGQVQLGWSEFEVVDQRLGLRLTRLG
jgi:flagellar motor switch/type III secretory pathway protein FliN